MKKIEAVIFDWAGTTVDYGSSAPSEVFDRVFSAAGLHLAKEEINRPMGLEKKATSGTALLRIRPQPVAGPVRPPLV